VEHGGRTYRGSSVSTNIVESSTRAFLEVLNRVDLARRTVGRSAEERSAAARAPAAV
jgi:hypothetical protein